MKKAVFALTTFLTISFSTVFAAPVNDLSKGQTAVGIGTDTFYLEHKVNNQLLLGIQNVDWDSNGSMDDLYGQFQLNSNLTGIIGNRNFNSGSGLYLGMAVNGTLAPEWDGYASLIAGNDFKELQVGANLKLTTNVDLNINYHSFMPDAGRNNNGVGIGATYKF